MSIRHGLLCIHFALGASLAFAQQPTPFDKGWIVENYAWAKDNARSQLETFFAGLEDGFSTANVRSGKPLYCVPEGLNLNPQNTMQIFETELNRRKYEPSWYISLILLTGLQRTFPCK